MNVYDNAHNSMYETAYYTSEHYTYEPTWIDREMYMLQWLEFMGNEESV